MKLFLQAVVIFIVVTAFGFAITSVLMTRSIEKGLEPYPIPSNYYNQPCQKPTHLTFYDWMATLQLPPKDDEFDCSQRSAYIEWLSENCYHRATIAAAEGHAWTRIEVGGTLYGYETTGPEGLGPWIPYESEFYSNPVVEWENISDVPLQYALFGLEYAWWEKHPELWR